MSNLETVEPPKESIDDFFIRRDKISTSTKFKGLVWGKPGLGKTYLALSCPEPVYVISTEPDSVTPLLRHFPDKDIRIMECSMPYTKNPVKKLTGAEDTSIGAYDPEEALRKIEKATELLKDVKEGTIVIDSVSDIWDYFVAWIEYNADHYLKSGQVMRTEWGKVNNKYRTLIDRLMSRPVHFMMTARAQNAFSGAEETATQIMSGQKKTQYIPHVIIELQQRPKQIVDLVTKKPTTKMITTGVIRKGRGLEETALGLEIERPTFEKLKEVLSEHGGGHLFS
jgi:hypothetical protein